MPSIAASAGMSPPAPLAGDLPPVRRRVRGRVRTAARVLLVAAWGALGCSAPHPSPGGETMRVEADLFSGRPNPVWTLDVDEEGEVARLLRGLRPGGPSPRPPGLGYRGMMLRGLARVLPGCAELRLFRGAAIAVCNGEHRTFVDADRAVERWLAASGRLRLDADLYQTLQTELER